jgi:CubicO group peptidase (beta-lactamase class C family)
MILRDQKKIYLDDPVTKFFPEFRLKEPFPTKRGITFRQLATHTAGLPRESPCSSLSCNFPTEEILRRLTTVQWIERSDEIPLYSNLGFSLLGNFIANISNSSFEELIMNKIVTPLGLSSTGVNITTAPTSNMAFPYFPSGEACDPTECLRDFGWTNPEGGMYSSARDLASLMSLFFRDNVPDQILDGATLREMCRISWLNSDLISGFAMPFELTQIGNSHLRGKQGDVNGYGSQILMLPSIKTGNKERKRTRKRIRKKRRKMR